MVPISDELRDSAQFFNRERPQDWLPSMFQRAMLDRMTNFAASRQIRALPLRTDLSFSDGFSTSRHAGSRTPKVGSTDGGIQRASLVLEPLRKSCRELKEGEKPTRQWTLELKEALGIGKENSESDDGY